MRLAIQSLAPPDQEILNLIGIKESSYEQAAKLLGISVNLAGVRLSEAKKRLGKIIKQSYPELLLYLPDEDP
jgi:DNA-directed RNA polymerase specialized sigma24 family protein